MTDFAVEKRPWWNYIGSDLKDLLTTSVLLSSQASGWSQKSSDYSFVVFPAAKAYEGYLKKMFLDRGFITNEDYMGKHFRIGKSLNPSLDKKYKDQDVYSKIIEYCGGKALADQLWLVWKNCRNMLFHYFPNEKNSIDLSQARESIMEILNVMDESFVACRLEK